MLFDEYFAKKTYGENYTIKDQVYSILPKNAADSLWKDMQWYMSQDTSREGNGNHMNGRTSGLLQFMMSKRFHRDVANPKKFEALFAKYNIRGAIYTGNGDGLCIVVYNYDEVIPIAYSVDGHTYKQRSLKTLYPDSVRRFNHLYNKVDFPIAIQCDGETIFFSRVQTKDGKWNYIDAKTNQLISPINFDSLTEINPQNGTFDIEYNGVFYEACPDGFYDEYGEGHEFSELPTFNSDNNSDLNENHISKMLQESIKKVIKEFKEQYKTLNEEVSTNDDVDEIQYFKYDVPDQTYFDSNDVPSIYHVTDMEGAKGIFKFGFDREFLRTYVYGKGVYAAYDIKNARDQLGIYGNVMIQIKLIGGYDRFIIFPTSDDTKRIAMQKYGRNYDVLSQLKTFLPEKDALYVYNTCGHNSNHRYADISSKYHIRGAVYQWGQTIAVLPYDFSSAVPYAISLDGGKTFEKKFNDELWSRFLTSIDTIWMYGDKYAQIDKTILGYNRYGEITGYARIKKSNSKWNYLDIQTGEEELPIDFDSITSMNPKNGEFQVEYQGKFFDACFDGFYDDNGEGHTWDEINSFVNSSQKNNF